MCLFSRIWYKGEMKLCIFSCVWMQVMATCFGVMPFIIVAKGWEKGMKHPGNWVGSTSAFELISGLRDLTQLFGSFWAHIWHTSCACCVSLTVLLDNILFADLFSFSFWGFLDLCIASFKEKLFEFNVHGCYVSHQQTFPVKIW